jgi:hypothetical protein
LPGHCRVFGKHHISAGVSESSLAGNKVFYKQGFFFFKVILWNHNIQFNRIIRVFLIVDGFPLVISVKKFHRNIIISETAEFFKNSFG